MFLVQLLYRRWTNDQRLYAEMGFPDVAAYSTHGYYRPIDQSGTIELSKHATQTWRNFRRKKVTHFYGWTPNEHGTYGTEVMLSIMCMTALVIFFTSTYFLSSFSVLANLALSFAIASLPNEIWSFIAVSKLKVITKYTKDTLKAEAWQIIEDNQRDLDLCAETQALLADYQARLTAHDMVCGSDTELKPVGAGAPWRVVDVQYHTVDDHPYGRDVTVTLSSDEHDGLTCVLPGEDSVISWLDTQLSSMRENVTADTHTYYMLKNLRAKNILKEVWHVPTDTLATVAKLVASSKQPFAEREPVTVHAELLPGGHAMLQAIGFTGAADAETALVFAPTAPIQHLSAAVVESFRLKGEHPALRQLPKAA